MVAVRTVSADCSRRTLETEFLRELGRTLNKELQRIRMNQVKELLISTPLSIAEIAAACGFRSVEYLHRIFRKQENTTPRKFRVNHTRAT